MQQGGVGVDRVPTGYYRAKLAAEQVIDGVGLPLTIQRFTQFHCFLAELFSWHLFGMVIVPRGWRFQPVDENAVAEALVERIAAGPVGRAQDVGGPEVLDLAEVARVLFRRPIALPIPGSMSGRVRAGTLCCPEGGRRGRSFAAWCRDRPK